MNDIKCNKNCKNCTFSCCRSGKDLILITYEELEKMGYVICEDFTTVPIINQD